MWRTKHNQDLIKLMEDTIDLTLYLVQEKGPLSFVFQDDSKKKYSINIGDKISCSCGGGKKEHCVHTIYVLNRIFKIPLDNELLLQLNFTDSEITKMINSRNSKTTSNKNKHYVEDNNDKIESISGKRMNLFDDITCSICQEDMYGFQNLYYCENSCGHNFHLHCLKVWSEYKIHLSDAVNCPMCRAEWTDDFKIAVMKSEKKNSRRAHRNITCKSCNRTNIKGDRIHCLTCQDFDICVECYILDKHGDHPMIVKKSQEERWMGIDSIKEYNVKTIRLSQYLIGLIPEYDTYEELEDKRCIVCKSDKASSLHLLRFKKLSCSHLIHYKCLEIVFKLIESKSNYSIDDLFNRCSTHNILIFPGLKSLGFNRVIKREIIPQDTEFVRKYGKDFNTPTSKVIFKSPKKMNKLQNGPMLVLNIEKLNFGNIEEPIKMYNNMTTKVKPLKVKDKIKIKDNNNKHIVTLPAINIQGLKVIDMKNLGYKVDII